MNGWTAKPRPAVLNACDCGEKDVEMRNDGISKIYRCAGCHEPLGNTTMGAEP